MTTVKLYSLEKQLLKASTLIKTLILFLLGCGVIFLTDVFFTVDLVAAFILVTVLSLFFCWLQHCQQKQLEIFQDHIQNPSLSVINPFSGTLAVLKCSISAQLIEKKVSDQNYSTTINKLCEVSEQLEACMEVINDSVAEEFEQIELLATAMNQMTATVKEVEGNAESASSSTAEATTVAAEGRNAVDATIASINALSKNIGDSSTAVNNVEMKVESIGSVVDTIRSISEQTNLLALNAAIEAARAGEAGRGFAVVADEVRNLAKRTQDATVEIRTMIEQLQQSAQQAVILMVNSVKEAEVGVAQVSQAGIKLSDIVEKVNHISDMNYQIASAAKEQATVADEINNGIEQVKEVVEGSVVVLREVTEMMEEVSGYSNALKD